MSRIGNSRGGNSRAGKRVGASTAAVAVLAAGCALTAALTAALAAASVASAASTASTASAAALTAASSVRVGHAPTVPRGSAPAAAPDDSRPLSLGVSLRPRDQAALADFVRAVSTPGSAEYHRYLSKGEFAARFGPAESTITATEEALRTAGLTVGAVTPDGLTIPVSTTIGRARAAFGINFTGYRLADGKAAYANTSAPLLPATVATHVSGIVGLDNLATATSNLVESGHSVPAPTTVQFGRIAPNGVVPRDAAPQVCASLTAKLSAGGFTDGNQYYSPAALSDIYDFTGDLAAGDNGSGVSVGVFELEGIDLIGVDDFMSCLGISTPVSVEKVDGGATAKVDGRTGVGAETALDVETLAGMAPGVSIVDYEGPDASGATDANLLDVYQKMVTDDTVKVISSSWSYCELDSDSSLVTSESVVFAEAAAQGQTVVAASGDSGSTGCYGNGTGHDATLGVDDPPSQPDVLSVGGTGMRGLTHPAVTAWNNSAPNGVGGATGGGVSAIWPLAGGGYQSGFTGTGYTNACKAASGAACRQVPDVAALADADSGYLTELYASTGPQGAGEYVGISGGTSGAAPVWAAVMALADASRACGSEGPVGLANPALYAAAKGAAAITTDVTAGNNVLAYSGYAGTDYPAGTGYDLATGLGTPLASGITQAVCDRASAGVPGPAAPTSTPASTQISAPPVGTTAPATPFDLASWF